METLVGFFQVRVSDVRVDLRGRDIGVTEHLLDRANICPVLDQMRGKRMPKRVRRHAFEAAGLAVSLYE